jgi:hypothetical protein
VNLNRTRIGEACRLLFIVSVVNLVFAGFVLALTEDDSTGTEKPRIVLEGGIFLPVGLWSEGFDPGISLGAGVDLPLKNSIEFGGRISRIEIRRENRVFFSWTAMEGRFAFYPPVDLSPFDLFISARGGLLKAAVEVGEGREEEWDILAGFGGGVVLPISNEFIFRCSALWQKVFAEGGGVSVSVGLVLNIF